MKNKNIIQQIISNAYVKNILLMFVVLLLLIGGLIWWLGIYTKHDESVDVPSIKTMQVEEAAIVLRQQGLMCEVVDSLFQTTGTPGAILEQTPVAGSKVKKGRTIFLTIQAKSIPLVPIPPLKDFSYRQAEAKLRSMGFNSIQIEEVASQYKGLVISVQYNGNPLEPNQKVPKGASLRMTVGGGGASVADTINIPNIDTNEPDIDPSFFD